MLFRNAVKLLSQHGIVIQLPRRALVSLPGGLLAVYKDSHLLSQQNSDNLQVSRVVGKLRRLRYKTNIPPRKDEDGLYNIQFKTVAQGLACLLETWHQHQVEPWHLVECFVSYRDKYGKIMSPVYNVTVIQPMSGPGWPGPGWPWADVIDPVSCSLCQVASEGDLDACKLLLDRITMGESTMSRCHPSWEIHNARR